MKEPHSDCEGVKLPSPPRRRTTYDEFRYGDDRTIHGTTEVNVERHPKTGKVVAVWFRCMRLPFSDSVCAESRAEEMAGSEGGDGRIKAIVFEAKP